MKRLAIALLISTYAFQAYAQAMQCQTLSDGRVVCTPAGGGSSIYR